MNTLLDFVLPFIFEKLPILNKLSGYKRTIGNILLIVAAALEAAKAFYPELEVLSVVHTSTLGLIGLLTRVFGDLHADSKERRD